MECVEKKNPEDQSAYPVPFGHVPYCPSLPGAMGPLWDFPTEWWYYAGWATDLTGSKQFTIYINTIRGLLTAAALEYTIGSTTSPGSKEYQIESSITEGLGNFPPATSTSWSISLDTVQSSSITCKLLSGTLGLPGATYQLEMVDDKNKVSLSLKDTFGMVMEGASGAQELQSYEYAMPSLSIQENSTITLAGVTTQLGSGSLWLDRQSINNNPKFVGRRFCSASKSDSGDSQRPLYTGNWLTVALNNDDQTVTRYMFAYFWPPKPNQWIVGSELEPPVYPRKKIGLEYPALPGWDGVSPVQGVNVLKNVVLISTS